MTSENNWTAEAIRALGPTTDLPTLADIVRVQPVEVLPDGPARRMGAPRHQGPLDRLEVPGRRPVRPGRPGIRRRRPGSGRVMADVIPNSQRAAAAADAIAAYAGASEPVQIQDRLAQLLCDLRHHADQHGVDFAQAQSVSERAYTEQRLQEEGPFQAGCHTYPGAFLDPSPAASPFQPVATGQGSSRPLTTPSGCSSVPRLACITWNVRGTPGWRCPTTLATGERCPRCSPMHAASLHPISCADSHHASSNEPRPSSTRRQTRPRWDASTASPEWRRTAALTKMVDSGSWTRSVRPSRRRMRTLCIVSPGFRPTPPRIETPGSKPASRRPS